MNFNGENFEKDFYAFLQERIERISGETAATAEYQMSQNKNIALFKQISEVLDDDHKV